MYPTDPTSVQQLRAAELFVANEAREHHRFSPRPDRAGGRLEPLITGARALRARLFQTSHVAVGVFSEDQELFRGLGRSQLESVATYLEVRSCSIGDSLGSQNEPASGFVIILDAQIGVSIDGLPVSVLDEGSHFGSVPLLDGDLLHRATFDVLEAGRIAVADPEQFRAILDRFPTVANRVYAMARSRRSYLEELASCEANQTLRRSTVSLLEYPAHLPV